MAALDMGKILQYEAEIKGAINVLTEITSQDLVDSVRDSLKIRALKYTLIVLVEAICNLCRHILAKKAFVAVKNIGKRLSECRKENIFQKKLPINWCR